MIIAVSGHRPNKLGGYDPITFNRLVKLAKNELQVIEPSLVYSGMAQGWDQAICSACLDLKIPYISVIPFIGFTKMWPFHEVQQYTYLLSGCQRCEVIGTDTGYNAYQMRNIYMVDHAEQVLALWNGTDGGTANTVRYAEKIGKPVINCWNEWEKLNGSN